MGNRCNLFVVSRGLIDVHYDHWAAHALWHELFWGPEAATAFVRGCAPRRLGARFGEVPGAALLDDVWAEGGALIDHDARCLLWFGGGDVEGHLVLHRVHLELMRLAWPGWRVEWAAEGQTDLARAVGTPEEEVISEDVETSVRLMEPYLFEDRILEWPVLATAVTGEGPCAAMISGSCEGLAQRAASPEGVLWLIAWSSIAPFEEPPEAGLHLDVPGRFLGGLTGAPGCGWCGCASRKWSRRGRWHPGARRTDAAQGGIPRAGRRPVLLAPASILTLR